MTKYLTLDEVFYRHVSPEPMSGCWLWTGTDNGRGYGRVHAEVFTGKKAVYAHHFALRAERGVVVPPGAVVRHKCDNKLCVNPDHLVIGTQRENMKDAAQRRRMSHGENHCHARLTEAAVADIRRRDVPQKEYAKRYGISDSHVSRIQNGIKWRHAS